MFCMAVWVWIVPTWVWIVNFQHVLIKKDVDFPGVIKKKMMWSF